MEMRLVRIEMRDFKSFKDKTIEFKGNTTIKARNGIGKTTIADAFFWVIADNNYALVSNPEIFPLNVEESNPTVTLTVDIDGIEHTLCRQMKRTVKHNSDGIDSVAYTSVYMVNSVTLGLANYKKKIEELGIDISKMLTLMHPEVFTSSKKDDARKILMQMAEPKSDLDICNMIEGTDELKDLLSKYSFDEVAAMQKSTIKHINDTYGKSGELLNKKIEGLEMSKANLEWSELELERNTYRAEIENLKAEIENAINTDALNDLKIKQAEVVSKMSIMRTSANENALNIRREKEQNVNFLKLALEGIKSTKANIERLLSYETNKFDDYKNQFDGYKAELKDAEAVKFDESKNFCYVCKREYPADKKAEIKAEWEQKREAILTDVKAKMDSVNVKAKDTNKLIKSYKAEIEKLNADIDAKLDEIEKATSEVENVVITDVTKTDEYNALVTEMTSLGEKIATLESKKATITVLKSNLSITEEKLRECENKLALAEHNNQIDLQIAELRKQQNVFESDKARAEKILYLLDLVSRKKNEVLVDSINSHFKLVDFSLFKYTKGGEYKEALEIYIDGYLLGTHTNKGREILAKLDILDSMQNFFDQRLPIFADNMESLSDDTRARIDLGTQLISLVVTEDTELKVED